MSPPCVMFRRGNPDHRREPRGERASVAGQSGLLSQTATDRNKQCPSTKRSSNPLCIALYLCNSRRDTSRIEAGSNPGRTEAVVCVHRYHRDRTNGALAVGIVGLGQEHDITGPGGGSYRDFAEAAGGQRDENGALRVDRPGDDESDRLCETRDFETDHYVDSIVTVEPVDQFVVQMVGVLDRVHDGSPVELNTTSEGLAVQRTVDAIYRSAETGRPVEVEPSP